MPQEKQKKQENNIEYYDGDVLLEGYCSYQDDNKKKPGVLVFHDWSGKNEFAHKKADQLAAEGYVAFAVDMYGKGKVAKTKEEKVALMQPVMQNRSLLQKRANLALDALKKVDMVDTTRLGAIGFCFGGLCALDLARSGADVLGVISFHGILNAPSDVKNKQIKAKLLVLQGFDDPMVPPEQVLHFEKEMTAAKVDWELDMYGGVMHAFANPEANDPGFGTVYNQQADKRSWAAMQRFFHEVFS